MYPNHGDILNEYIPHIKVIANEFETGLSHQSKVKNSNSLHRISSALVRATMFFRRTIVAVLALLGVTSDSKK
jgi:hypothetical protein